LEHEDHAPASEAEFFDAGEQGTYEGGPRSGVPEPFVEESEEHAVAPLPSRRVAPARRARARRSTKVVAGILALSLIPLSVALWQNVARSERGTDELARDDAPSIQARELASAPADQAREGWPVAPRNAAEPSISVVPAEATSGEESPDEAPTSTEPAAPVADMAAPTPASAAVQPAAPRPKSASTVPPADAVARGFTSTPRRPVALPRSTPPALLEPSRPAPVGAATTRTARPALPPRSAVEKPPTASFPVR
jgi:hypothetical protein